MATGWNYPDGFDGGPVRHEMVDHRCPKCGETFEVPMYYELGAWFYHDDPWCPECNVEGEMVR